MADMRKLQCEIDRCFKRVAEGVKQFEDIWQKLQNAANSNQKEKHEAELKKEIKKLQRLRDQLKTWIASNEIKDKQQLVEHRKLVEIQMERFKEVERESKIKSYSKEGLGLTPKFDPAQKEKEETVQWLTNTIDTLNMQVDQFESEVESLSVQTGKKKGEKERQDRVTELRKSIERHRFHIRMLETILRMLDNDSVPVDSVQKIKDDVAYYINSSQDPDFEENEFLYDDLDLEEIPAALAACASPSSGQAVSPTSSATSSVEELQDKKSVQWTDNEVSQSPVKNGTPCLLSSVSASATCSATSSPSLASLASKARAKSVVPTSNGLVGSFSSVVQQYQPPQQQQQQQQQHAQPPSQLQQPPQMKTCFPSNTVSPPSRPLLPASASTPSLPAPGTPVSQAAGVAWGGLGMSSNALQSSVPVETRTPPITSLSSGVTAANGAGTGGLGVQGSSPAPCSSSSTGGPWALIPGQSVVSVVCSAPAAPARPPSRLKQSGGLSYSAVVAEGSTESPALIGTPSQSQSRQPSPVASSSSSASPVGYDVSAPPNSPSPFRFERAPPAGGGSLLDGPPSHSAYTRPSEGLRRSEPLISLKAMAERSVLGSRHLHLETANLRHPSEKDVSVSSSATTETPAAPAPRPAPLSEVSIPPSLGVCPLGPTLLSKDQLYQQAMQEAAWAHMPRPADSERTTRNHHPHPCPTSPFHHSDSAEFYQRFMPETLFFIFYYLEGTRAQYLAAEVLKKQSWMFHNKYMMWFQRRGEPKIVTTGEFEQGTYVYFDYEKWDWRQLEGFVLEYRYLEDI